MKYGYIRVSSKTQDEERQIQALFSYGVSRENIFIDKASGKNFIDRENWEKLMAKVIVNDIIVIKELDRLGRNNNEIKDTFELLKNKRVFLEFIEQPILNTANKSELEMELLHPIILHLLGYFAEKERVKIRQRQREAYNVLETDKKGRKISRKKGKVVGRPNKIENLTTEQKRYVKAWIDKSIKLRDCIKLTGLSSATLYRIKQNMGNVDKRRRIMENKEKELYLKKLRVEEDLDSMNDELSNLIEKYPQNVDLQTLKNENKFFYESDVLDQIRETYLNNLRDNFSATEFENILEKYNMELEKIKKWLNDVAKEYLKNNFKQEELRNYWFGGYEDMPVIIESGE